MTKLNKLKFFLLQGMIETETTASYEGKPIPKWLQKPVYAEARQNNQTEKIPEWVLQPVHF